MTEREVIRSMYLMKDFNLIYCYSRYYAIIYELLDRMIEQELMCSIKGKENVYCLSKNEAEDGTLVKLIITRSGYTSDEPKEVILSVNNDVNQHFTYVWCTLKLFSYLKDKDQVTYKVLENRLNDIIHEKA